MATQNAVETALRAAGFMPAEYQIQRSHDHRGADYCVTSIRLRTPRAEVVEPRIPALLEHGISVVRVIDGKTGRTIGYHLIYVDGQGGRLSEYTLSG